MDYTSLIPFDIISSIVLFCNIHDILRLTCVNKLFNTIIDNNTFWKKVLLRDKTFSCRMSKNVLLWNDICNRILNGELSYKSLTIAMWKRNAKFVIVTISSISISLYEYVLGDILVFKNKALSTITSDIRRIYNNNRDKD